MFLPIPNFSHHFSFNILIRTNRPLFKFGGQRAQKFLAEDAVLAADFVGAQKTAFQEPLHGALAYSKNFLSFGRGVDGSGLDFIHKLS